MLELIKKNLKEKLDKLSKKIKDSGNETFIFYRDIQNRGEKEIPEKQIMKLAFEELKKSDVVFIYVDNPEKSEGMLLEAGFAKASGKKIILKIKNGINLKLLETLANEIIKF